jgi:hypothetical protein
MATKNNRPPHKPDRAPASAQVSPGDRAAARQSLETVKSPLEIMARVGGSDVRFDAVMLKVHFLIETAEPLPVALRARLAPWLAEIDRRREAVLEENRALEADRRSGASA